MGRATCCKEISMRHMKTTRQHWERGASSVEFAIVLPLFMLMFFAVMGLAIWAYSALFAATGVPVEARASGIHTNSPQMLNALRTTSGAAGSLQVSQGAPGCARAVYARLNASPAISIPMLGEVAIRLRAGSQTRNWQFWPGKPADGCE
jgi:hypothetical protein